jgi:hypothetical protein
MKGTLIVIALFSSVCDLPFTSGDCATALLIQVAPAETTLSVGQRFTSRISLKGCRGRTDINETWAWTSADTTVVRVEPTTGVATAVGAGRAQLHARDATYGSYLARAESDNHHNQRDSLSPGPFGESDSRHEEPESEWERREHSNTGSSYLPPQNWLSSSDDRSDNHAADNVEQHDREHMITIARPILDRQTTVARRRSAA